MPSANPCANCGSLDAKSACGACFTVCYCNKACQTRHWRAHKRACKAARLDLGDGRFPTPNRECAVCKSPSTTTCGTCEAIHYCGAVCLAEHRALHSAAACGRAKARLDAQRGSAFFALACVA